MVILTVINVTVIILTVFVESRTILTMFVQEEAKKEYDEAIKAEKQAQLLTEVTVIMWMAGGGEERIRRGDQGREAGPAAHRGAP